MPVSSCFQHLFGLLFSVEDRYDYNDQSQGPLYIMKQAVILISFSTLFM